MEEQNNQQNQQQNNQPVDKSTQPVDNSQNTEQNQQQNNQPVDNSTQPVDNSQNREEPVDNLTHSGDSFDAEAYINSITPNNEPNQPNIEQLQSENKLLKQQRDALKTAYLRLRSDGITVVSNPQVQQNQSNPNSQVDALIDRYVKGHNS